MFWRYFMKYNITIFHVMTYLFFIGSILGWCIELVYRRFAPDNKERKWVNPGFCAGPYLPIYGIVLVVLFLLAFMGETIGIDKTLGGQILMFVIMAIVITIIEYFAGLISIKCFNVRLWDYTNEFMNFQGIICLKFTFYWWLLSAVYYFAIDDHVWAGLGWLNDHVAFLFIVGYFFGVFTVDLVLSANVLVKIKNFAKENEIVVKLDKVQEKVLEKANELSSRNRFFVRNLSKKIFDETMNQHMNEFKNTYNQYNIHS